MVGEHVVRGNYTPEIRFALAQGQDFMAPLTPAQTALPSGAVKLSWPAVAGATGYFARTIGSNESRDLVFWSSGGVPAMMGDLMDWLPPPEVKRLIASKAVLAPTQTECVIPQQVRKAVPQGMLQMIAYGSEVNFAAPPTAGKAKGTKPEWIAKVRFKSTTNLRLGGPGEA